MRTKETIHATLLAGAVGAALLSVPTTSFADPDDAHKTVVRQNLDEKLDTTSSAIRHKDRRIDRQQDRTWNHAYNKYDAEKDNIRDRMQSTSGEQRKDLQQHLDTMRDRYQARKDDIRDHAEDARARTRDGYTDRKERLQDKTRDDRDRSDSSNDSDKPH